MRRSRVARVRMTWNAFASRQERGLRSFEVGKHADVVVLSDDVFMCDEAGLPEIRPVLTLVSGKIVDRAS